MRMPSRVKSTPKNFCSRTCLCKFNGNKAKQKADTRKICKVCSIEFTVRKSEAHRFSTCSKKCQRLSRTEENNPNWQGGKTIQRQSEMAKIEYKQWRKSVYIRDNYTCQHCGQIGGNLEAHHIKSWKDYPELRHEITNGVTLCIRCHRKTFKNLSYLST